MGTSTTAQRDLPQYHDTSNHHNHLRPKWSPYREQSVRAAQCLSHGSMHIIIGGRFHHGDENSGASHHTPLAVLSAGSARRPSRMVVSIISRTSGGRWGRKTSLPSLFLAPSSPPRRTRGDHRSGHARSRDTVSRLGRLSGFAFSSDRNACVT